MLKSGIPWQGLPREIGCGCGMTCWRRLRDRQRDGTWEKIHKALLARLRADDELTLGLAIIDSNSVRAAYGGKQTGPNPVDRAEPGTEHHVIVEAHGIPLASSLTEADVHDVKELAPLYNMLPAVGGKVGHPRTKPDAMMADRGYDSEPHREGLRQDGGGTIPGGEEYGEPERVGEIPPGGGADLEMDAPESPAPDPV